MKELKLCSAVGTNWGQENLLKIFSTVETKNFLSRSRFFKLRLYNQQLAASRFLLRHSFIIWSRYSLKSELFQPNQTCFEVLICADPSLDLMMLCRVGHQSNRLVGASISVPAFVTPGHRIIPGTRMPPSNPPIPFPPVKNKLWRLSYLGKCTTCLI